MLKKPQTVKALEELGRVQLSPSFFMRDFLYSEISQIERIPNIPNNPDLAIKVGKKLCVEILEPIQNKLGKISIRSAYRSPKVNNKGAEHNNQYNCSSNENSYARHIWDVPDKDGEGAIACIVVNSFLPYYEKTKHWQALAWWIHEISTFLPFCALIMKKNGNIGKPIPMVDSYDSIFQELLLVKCFLV